MAIIFKGPFTLRIQVQTPVDIGKLHGRFGTLFMNKSVGAWTIDAPAHYPGLALVHVSAASLSVLRQYRHSTFLPLFLWVMFRSEAYF